MPETGAVTSARVEDTAQGSTPRRADLRRIGWGIVLALGALPLGFFLGGMVGGRFFVPAGSGFAGAATVLLWGLGGVVVLGGVAVWMARAASIRSVQIASAVAILLCVVVVALSVAKAVGRHTGDQVAPGSRLPTSPVAPPQP